MYRILILAIILVSSAYHSVAYGQEVQKLKVADLETILNNKDNKLYVINFWASWCAPCVSELPAFKAVSRDYAGSEVRFIFISLDFPSKVDQQLIPFLKKNKIDLDVALMTETDANLWIDKVDPSWQGNIPATLFLNNRKAIRYFHPEALSEQELRKLIKSYL